MIKQKEPAIAVALGSVVNGKVCLVVGSNVPTVDSGSIVKQISSEIGGSGGGRKDFAQAGGTNPAGLDKAFARFKELVK
jgi:alanyl-tRNA synthetase